MGAKTKPDYIRFLYIAYGSTCEMETQAMIAEDLGYISRNITVNIQENIREVERMIKALNKSLEGAS